MFAPHTIKSILILACADPGATKAEKDAIQFYLSGAENVGIVPYKRAAQMLNLSVMTVRKLVKKGQLKTIGFGDGKNILGITEKSIRELTS